MKSKEERKERLRKGIKRKVKGKEEKRKTARKSNDSECSKNTRKIIEIEK